MRQERKSLYRKICELYLEFKTEHYRLLVFLARHRPAMPVKHSESARQRAKNPDKSISDDARRSVALNETAGEIVGVEIGPTSPIPPEQR